MTTSDLFDVEEGAVYVHVKTATIRDWVFKKKIPFVKMGRRVLLRRQDLDKLIADSVVPAQLPRTPEQEAR
jgi:excisionase family DNA binding protein